VAATLLALVLGLQAVHTVSTSLTDRPARAALSPGSVKAALADTTTVPPDVVASDGDSNASAAAASSGGGTTNGGGTIGPGPAGPSPSSEDEGGSSSSETIPAPAAPDDRTYQLVGGTVGVRFENGTAHLLYATPNPGFTTSTSGSSDHVDVRFESDSHESRLRAEWNNGPQATTEENDK
jgi:hypothetical protein